MDWSTKYTLVDVAIAIGIGLAVAFLGGLLGLKKGKEEGFEEGKEKGRNQTKAEYKRRYDQAITTFAKQLLDEIIAAKDVKDEELVVHAKAIVSLRNQMRETLTNIQKQLNSDIDRLEELTRKDGKLPSPQIREIIGVLNRTWPSKKERIEVDVRKLLAELGLQERASDA